MKLRSNIMAKERIKRKRGKRRRKEMRKKRK
jgi:hypothetical protein